MARIEAKKRRTDEARSRVRTALESLGVETWLATRVLDRITGREAECLDQQIRAANAAKEG